jgi:hypothetical protein
MAQYHNLAVDQGASWQANLTVYASNSSGTFAANLYQYANGAGQIRPSFTAVNPGPTDATANIAVSIHTDNIAGNIVLTMNSVVTAGVSAGRYYYDVELRGGPVVADEIEGIISDGTEELKTLRAAQGIINVKPQITSWDW